MGEEANFRLDIYAIGLMNIKPKRTLNIWDRNWTLTSSVRHVYAAPENILTVSSTTRSMTERTDSYYLLPQLFHYSVYNSPNPVTGGVYLRLYGKVYDEDGTLIYPLEEWRDDPKLELERFPSENEKTYLSSIRNIDDCGVLRLCIGDENDLQVLSGHKYVFTIDFTNGVGNYSAYDPEHPLEPIVPNSLSVHVTMEDWLSTDIDKDSN